MDGILYTYTIFDVIKNLYDIKLKEKLKSNKFQSMYKYFVFKYFNHLSCKSK